jgi:hypothetical protein
MEQLTNTLLPARMFVVCSNANYGNGIFGSSYFDEILKQVQDDDFKKAQRQKVNTTFSWFLLWGIGSFMEWRFYGME